MNDNEISVAPERIQSLLNALSTVQATELKVFLGSLVMIRCCFSEWAELLAPLNECSYPDKVEKGEEQEDTFVKVKTHLKP